MYFNELSLLSLEEIYKMSDCELKSFELVKRLLVDELKRLEEAKSDDAKFVKKAIKDLVLLHDSSGTGHNLD